MAFLLHPLPELVRDAGRALALSLVLALLTLVILQAWRLAAADVGSAASRQQVARWVKQGAPVPEPEWTAVQARLLTALKQTPENPALWEALADLSDLEVRPNFGDAAMGPPPEALSPVTLRTRVVEARPLDAMAWARLAAAQAASSPHREDWARSWRKARQLAPDDPAVHHLLLQLAMNRWPLAPPDVRAWVQAEHLRASPPERDAMEQMGRTMGIRWVAP